MYSSRISRLLHLTLFIATLSFVAASGALAAEVYGRIWFAGTKAPAVGATVSVGPDQTALVDKNGHYRIKEVPSGWLEMVVTAKDNRTSKPLKVKVSGLTRVNIELAPDAAGTGLIPRRR